MYALTVKNNYVWEITADGGKTQIPPNGGSHTFQKLGNMFLNIPGMGQMTFIDLGDKKLEGYPEVKETWGVLVRGATVEAYYRYEGGGELTAHFHKHGSCSLSTTHGTLIPISMEELDVKVSGIPIST